MFKTRVLNELLFGSFLDRATQAEQKTRALRNDAMYWRGMYTEAIRHAISALYSVHAAQEAVSVARTRAVGAPNRELPDGLMKAARRLSEAEGEIYRVAHQCR